jgi:hypothetical protein
VELAIQQRALAQPLPGCEAGPGEAGADKGSHHALACGFVCQHKRHVIVAQGFVQAVHHAPAQLVLVQRSGEFRAQPQQGGLSLRLGALGRRQTFPLGYRVCDVL